MPLRRRGQPSGPLRVGLPLALLDVLRDGPEPLVDGADPGQDVLRIAVVIPQFRRGSGGHSTIAHLVRGLEARGHVVSLHVHDEEGRHDDDDVQALFARFFGPLRGAVEVGLPYEEVDVVVATGWQTVAPALQVSARARAYLVQDHEPEFYATSAERLWAEWTYRQGLHCVCASPWLAAVVRDEYGASSSSFDLGVDHERYRPLPTHRVDDLLLVYARAVTARRAVPLALLTCAELHHRRPELRIALFGEVREVATPFPHEHLGVLAPGALAEAYATASVGLVLSLTNPSLVPTEMLACGLPVVDVRSPSMLATFSEWGPVRLADPDPLALADAVEEQLDDLVERADRVRLGLALTATRSWDAAAGQVEAGLREALSIAAAR